ncbi:hypothetical protein M569_16528 [Genlisea aurea]|uniref:Pentacotripeptide-repeat region of PRORP domain-containing protein n=1 Tax=Genlisea aurea TaxID=192259 RepID=S8DFY0_9LAMI|nr:hypothetical protein M569_16528 [Genlisea aurea]
MLRNSVAVVRRSLSAARFPPSFNNLCYGRRQNADDMQIGVAATDDELTETICRLISRSRNPADLESALDSAVTARRRRRLSPALVLQVLKKLNVSGTAALLFFRWAERRSDFESTAVIYDALIESLCKIKQFKTVWILVDEMKSRGLLSRTTFALICRRLARARRAKETLEAFRKMKKTYGFTPQLQDYNSLLDSFAKSQQVGIAQALFDELKNRKKFTPDVKTYTILLEGWGRESNLLRLDEVRFEMRGDGLEPDVVSYGILIHVHCRAGKHDEAIRLYHEMEGKNLKPTPHIYCTLINALGSGKRLSEAIEFFELSKNGPFPIEAPTYNSVVGAYCWSNRMDDAFRIVEEMRNRGLGPNSRTYDVLLHHHSKLRRIDEAFVLFLRMGDEGSGCKPTLSTYTIMVRMFCNEGRMDMARFIWDGMKARGVLPGVHVFSAMIDGLCCNGGRVDECEEVSH